MVDIYPTTPKDQHLPMFDNTKLYNINTCPRWGLIRYELHKTRPAAKRSLALEAGSASHEFYAALRAYQLVFQDKAFDSFEDQVGLVNMLFGPEKQEKMFTHISELHQYGERDWKTEALNFCMQAFINADFFDDPDDKYRTSSNIQEALIGYFDRWWLTGKTQPVYVEDTFVGIELPLDVVIDFGHSKLRFVGRCDGLHTNKNGDLVLHENKTGGKIDSTWELCMETTHQITGYVAALSAIIGKPIHNARALGMQIPRPRTSEGISIVDIERNQNHIKEWLQWMEHTLSIWEKYKDDPADAPMYTHSCNRFFRPCPLIDVCSHTTADERREILENEFITEEWSPLEC